MIVEQFFLFVLMALVSYRVWRLIGYDNVTQGVRDKLPEKSLKLIECPWCLGTWVSFAVVAGTAWWVDVRWPWLQAFAVSVLVGWLHGTLEANEEIDVVLEEYDD